MNRSTYSNIEKELMDLTKAKFSEFSAKMKERFGNDTFDKGYHLMNKNKMIVIGGDDHEIHDLLKELDFTDDKSRDDFIRFTSTYIIVHGAKY